ncbi:succinate dehydrogenase hydrophobic membrane anchor subunit [Halobacterium hubeiense]|uniref:succinate dehydrogenase hydrophobic membrane anchor subunit n=1 Tax=Halobacterium hubeiense TaxID=1407499 RepID=UPI000B7E911D|nr:succinate dehydrogenase hydrophobic membrane anchor subunit [Halobacterium hubeiense]
MAQTNSSFNTSGTMWFLQRVTGIILVALLAFHFIVLHFINHAAEISFAGTAVRMEQLWYFILMIAFLVTAAFHGVNGVYNALVNQGISGRRKTIAKWVLGVAGVFVVCQGLVVAFAFIGVI